MPHTWGGSEADRAPAVPPFLLPVFTPGVAPAAFVDAAVAATGGVDVTFATVVATLFSVSL